MLEGKFGVVFGVANKRSIAWSIAEAWHKAGARLALTYQGERLQRNVTQLAARFGDEAPLYPCDVTRDDEIQDVFRCLTRDFGKIHLVLHSVAFAPREALEGRFVDTTRQAFAMAQDVSAYSLVGIARAALPLMPRRTGKHGALPGKRSLRRGYRRGALRGLRIQHHGNVRN